MDIENITIGITDDDALIVGLLDGFFKTVQGINVLLTANNGIQLLAQLEEAQEKPQIVLLDLKMDGMDGIEATGHLKTSYPDIKIIVISSHYQKSFMGFMMKTGVAAFLPKGISPAELVEVIKMVHKQGFYFREDQLDIIRNQITSKSPQPILKDENMLSEREREVLKLICRQKTAKEIGERMFITQRTVEGHKNNLFIKTGAKNIAGLVIYSIQNGIMSVDELPVI